MFQEGKSAPQTPQPFFDADFEGLASNAELYIFNQDDSQEQAWAYFGYVLLCLGLYITYILCKVISANTITITISYQLEDSNIV